MPNNYGPDVDYVLYGAFEMLDITPDVHTWITVCRPNISYDELMGGELTIEHLKTAYVRWYENASLSEKAFVHHLAYADFTEQKQTAISTITSSHVLQKLSYLFDVDINISTVVNSNIFMGNKINYRNVRRLTVKEKREFTNDIIISEHVSRWIYETKAMLHRFADVVNRHDYDDLVAIGRAEHIASLPKLAECVVPVVKKTNDKKEMRAARKILRRSVEMMQKVIGEKPVSLFFSQDKIVITGQYFKYEVSKRADIDLLRNAIKPGIGHIPYKLRLLSMNDEPLANGCITFKETPAIDQITALFLHIKNGNEREVISTTNWNRISSKFNTAMLRIGFKSKVYGVASDIFFAHKKKTKTQLKKTVYNRTMSKVRKMYEELKISSQPYVSVALERFLK